MTRTARPRRSATRTTRTAWGRTVTSVAPGAIDDPTLPLFSLDADHPAAAALDAAAPVDLFTEWERRTFPGVVVDMAPAVEQAPACVVAPSLALTVDAPAPLPAPAGPVVGPAALDAVTVHLLDTPREVRTAIRTGDAAPGDVVAVVGERATVAAIVVDGTAVALDADGFAAAAARYPAAAAVAAQVAATVAAPERLGVPALDAAAA